jgi:hypothetical protein
MRHSIELTLCLAFLVVSCSDLGPEQSQQTDSIDADHSTIADPRARWQAYQLRDYVLEQQRMCFCINGGETCLVYVANDKVTDAIRKSDGKSILGEFGSLYRTANQLLDLADSLNAVPVARLVVEYDSKFGFPKYIWVDPNAQIADEEYGYRTTSIRKLLK